jgi:hypothetical protein
MTTNCANAACGERFQYFRSGKIYLIDFKAAGKSENHAREAEYFWLCGDCAQKMRVTLNSEGSVILEQLAAAAPSRKKPTAERDVLVKAVSLSGIRMA